ncbi:MAG TPA: PQQ-dependent sugar dehydrogenase [Acidimicrobiales bacterium]|nr:PQQ-dependent sugar dehydrogenase [Acidimicrobiales bacterium]
MALLTAAALLGACGGGKSKAKTSTASASTSSSATTASPTTTPTTAPPQTAAPGPAAAPTTARPSPQPAPAPSSCNVAGESPPGGTIAANFPTALAFAPDGRLFFTERSGTVRVYQGGTARQFATVSTVTSEAGGGYSERGLLGMAISPTFAQDRFVYAFYSSSDRVHQYVVRWADCGGVGTGAVNIIQLPAGDDCCHKGGRLAFGPDGKLYVTLGEEHTASAAQNTSDVRGKVLRYNPDGSVPADNPFGPGNPVWAFGLRNPFGIAISSAGQMAVTSNGPTGDAGSPGTGYDTLILSVARGRGYQWPNCYGYSHPLQPGSCGNGQSEPDWSSEQSTVVPTGAAFVDGSGPAGYAGHLVFCTFNNGMEIASPGSPHAAVSPGPSNCKLDVKQGPDHALYFSDTAHIYRLG